MVTRVCRATGETLLAPVRNHRSKVGCITGNTGKATEGERVADGSEVAMTRSNVRRTKGPAVHKSFDNMGGKGVMTKAPVELQDLRRKIYAKAKADASWRFWGSVRPHLQDGDATSRVRKGQGE
jgi:hypothetical protein